MTKQEQNKQSLIAKISFAMEMAFLNGVGFGQAKMEEDMDKNFFDAFLQLSASNTLGGGSAPCHTVALPNTIDIIKDKKGNLKTIVTPDYEGKYVRYKLRSDKWRNAMFNGRNEFKQELKNLIEYIENDYTH